MSYLPEEVLHDFLLFNVTDAPQGLGGTFHNLLYSLFTHVGGVNGGYNLFLQCVMKVVSLLEIVFCGSRPSHNQALQILYRKKDFVGVFSYTFEVLLHLCFSLPIEPSGGLASCPKLSGNP